MNDNYWFLLYQTFRKFYRTYEIIDKIDHTCVFMTTTVHWVNYIVYTLHVFLHDVCHASGIW